MPAPSAAEHDLDGWMHRGIQLHTEGQLEQALAAFENARRCQSDSTHAASATATVLTALARPMAAYGVLQSVAPQLMEEADGAANLAIAAEACGDMVQAHVAYARALQLVPGHLRTLNNLGLIAAGQSQWSLAIHHAQQCVERMPGEPSYHHNLSDFLTGARRYTEALAVLDAAAQQFPDHLDITVRQIAVLAFSGAFEPSRRLAAGLEGAAQDYLQSFLAQALNPLAPQGRPKSPIAFDPLRLFTGQAFEAMAECDWRNNDTLTAALRQAIAGGVGAGNHPAWRDAGFYGLMLDLHESELAQVRQISTAAIASNPAASLPPFKPGRKTRTRSADSRIHVGLLVPSLHNPQQRLALQRQLAQHDASRFAIHVYADSPRPELACSESLRPHAVNVMETAHLTDTELASRIRLDQLDVFVERAWAAPVSRPEVAALRVAPVQMRQFSGHRDHAPGPWDYTLSDRFIHPDGLDLAPCGPVLRLPHSGWLAVHADDSATPGPLWAPDDLPEDALLLCARVAPTTLEPQTFAVWLQILHALPQALLYLPGCSAVAAGNLVREARDAGVDHTRLVFASSDTNAGAAPRTRRPDLFLDPLRFSAAQGLEEALRMGVPAISCAGHSMASRLGGSLLQSAGLPGCVLDSPQAYVAEAVRLGRDAQARLRLREQLQTVTPMSALFDLPARVRDWEAAWTWTVQRSRDGLPPVAFSLPLQPENQFTC